MLMYFIQASQLSTELRFINTPPNTCEKKDMCDGLDHWQPQARGEKSARSGHAPGAVIFSFPRASFNFYLTDAAAKEEKTVVYDNENHFLRFIILWTRRKAIWFNSAKIPKKNSSQKESERENLQLTIMKTYGRPTRRFAMANVRTHALTKKATLLAQRLARRRVRVKMKNFTTSRSRPAMKAREDYRSHLTQIAFNLQKCFIWQELMNRYFTFIFANFLRNSSRFLLKRTQKARRVDE